MHIRPFSGMLLAEPIKQSEITQGGIFIPDNARSELKSQYKVVAVGRGRIIKRKNGKHLRLATEVGVGEMVVANTYAGKVVEVDGKSMRLLDQSSIMAVVSESMK